MSRKLNTSNIKNRLKYWQQILRLQDWIIVVDVARYSQLDYECIGESRINMSDKFAKLRLVDPQDYDSAWVLPLVDWEETLVHELVHIYTQPWVVCRGSLEHTIQEQMINMLTSALLKLSRKAEACQPIAT